MSKLIPNLSVITINMIGLYSNFFLIGSCDKAQLYPVYKRHIKVLQNS